MPYGDSQPALMNYGGKYRAVPGLRNSAPPSDIKVYKMVSGKKVLIRIEKASV